MSVSAPLAARIAAAVRAVPGVADLHAGRYGEVAMLYPRQRVSGLRRTAQALEVYVVVDLAAPRPLADIDAEVRAVIAPLIDAPVTLCFADAREPAA
ncbi:hypothetical protein [Corynebacterium nasicanis]|uniref:Cation efflux protein cytoplasmic domain-containing protein n=1 Tax=Corynebacterium nasicanis TaxID=1448267 RepID=A0ABW1QEY7_9CORY